LFSIIKKRNVDITTADTWCSLGPGAIKGIFYIFAGRNKELSAARVLHDVCTGGGKHLLSEFAAFGVDFPNPPSLSLDLKSIKHRLCEFNKYVSHIVKQKPAGSILCLKVKSLAGCGQTVSSLGQASWTPWTMFLYFLQEVGSTGLPAHISGV
jgi:hypothetical protein